jgi:tetratricopeptide (TPR) repeat protein
MGGAGGGISFLGDKPMNRLTRALIALVVVLACASIAAAQNVRCSGQVFDRDGKPWAGLTVSLKSESGRNFTLKTDKDGRFTQIGLSAGVYTFTLTSPDAGLNYSEQHQLLVDQDNNITINFKTILATQAAANPDQQKAAADQANKFKDMQTHFLAGRAALDDWDTVHKQLAATPADQRQPLQDKMAADSKTAISELQLAEQGVQPKDVKNHAVVWSNLGQAYDRANQPQDAVGAYQKAIDLQPSASFYDNQSTALANLAVTETDPKVAQQRVTDASADCDKAGTLDPTPGSATVCWKNLGIVLSNKGDFKDAVPPLQKATTLNPKDVQAWFLLGSAYTGLITPNQQGDKMTYDIPPGTADAYQKVIDLDPNGPLAAQAKQNLDALAAMSGGDATSVGVRKKKKSS